MAKAIIPIDQLPVYSVDSPPHPETDFASGAIILLDKPGDWSSFKGVKWVRRHANIKKVGHAGTLDPMATGLLIICTGKATRSIDQIQVQEKTYEAEISFGASTPSYDAETEADESAEWKHITEEAILNCINNQFTGTFEQIAPAYSALKHKGKPLYKYARSGEEVVQKKRDVTVYQFEVKEVSLPKVAVVISCSKGTYIRSIAHDLGLALDSRAHLSALRRTRIGDFDVDIAMNPEQFADSLNPEK